MKEVIGGRVAAFGAVVTVVGFAAAVAEADTVRKVAVLTGGQETPGVVTPASGTATIEIDTDTNTFTYRIVFSGLVGTETGAHVHGLAGPGATAGVIAPLPAGSPKVGSFIYDKGVEAGILAGESYINIHSTTFPGGEIRGQIVDLVAPISGDQSGSGSPGAGMGFFNVDPDANELSYYIDYDGLIGTETAAHIHGFALHGAGAGVKHGLPAGTPKVGTWNYDEGDEMAILNGLTYVNVHTTTNPSGEIRGQVTRFVAQVDGEQEAPPSGATGQGMALLAVDEAGHALSYRLTYQDLTGPATAAHIHGFAPPGGNAGVLEGIGTANPASATWAYGAGNAAAVLDGLTYINVHTGANPPGEIRGQLEFPPLVTPTPPCEGDTNGDDLVDVVDLVNVILDWGCAELECIGDVNYSGNVDVQDLVVVILAWGECK